MRGVAAGVVLQLTLGAPFLLAYPASYVGRAFELTRVGEGLYLVAAPGGYEREGWK